MFKISVVNIKDIKELSNGIYIGRYNRQYNLNSSLLANPYIIGKDGSREDVIQKYRYYLWNEIKHKTKLYYELCRIAKLVKAGVNIKLVCCCKPEICHGDIIIKAIKWMLELYNDLNVYNFDDREGIQEFDGGWADYDSETSYFMDEN